MLQLKIIESDNAIAFEAEMNAFLKAKVNHLITDVPEVAISKGLLTACIWYDDSVD